MSTIVAVGQAPDQIGVTMWSDDDGATWTAAASPLDGGWMRKVAWDDAHHVFIAVGYSPNYWTGTPPYTSNQIVMTSPDGKIWTAQTTPVDAAFGGTHKGPSLLAAGNGVAVIVGSDPTGADGWTTLVSTDGGVTWTTHTTPWTGGASENNSDIKFADGLFLTSASNSFFSPTYALWSSTDGVTWTALSDPSIYHPGFIGEFGVLGFDHQNHQWLADGIYWNGTSYQTTLFWSDNATAVTWQRGNPGELPYGTTFPPALLLGADSGVTLDLRAQSEVSYTSTDRHSWTTHDYSGGSPTIGPFGGTNGDMLKSGTHIVIGQDGGSGNHTGSVVAYGSDLIVWTFPVTPFDGRAVNSIAIGGAAPAPRALWHYGGVQAADAGLWDVGRRRGT